MTEYEGYVCSPGEVGRLAIIVSKFNKTITENLLQGALGKLREHMFPEDNIDVVRVPGAFELPTLAERFAQDEEYAAIICLGCVIKGETPHDEYINSAVSHQLARIGAEYCLPVVFGLLTCTTVEQAIARSGGQEVGKDKTLGEQPGNKGAEAAEVALEMLDLFGKLPELNLEIDSSEFESLARNSERYMRGEFETVDVEPDELVDLDDDGDMDWLIRRGMNKLERDGKHPGHERGDASGERQKRRVDKDAKFGKKPNSGDRSFKKNRDKKHKK